MRGQRLTTRLLVVALLFGLLVSVPLAGAPAAARQDEQLQIVFSVPGLNFPFFVHMVNIAEEKAAELDIELIVQDGQDDSATQSANLEAAIAQGVDGVVISPKDVQALAPAMQAVVDAGIPVVTIDRAVEGVEMLGHVGADNVRGGEKQGEYLMEILPEGGNIIELQGTVGASPAIDRSAGFNSVIADHPEYRDRLPADGWFQARPGTDRQRAGAAGQPRRRRYRRCQRRHGPRRRRGRGRGRDRRSHHRLRCAA